MFTHARLVARSCGGATRQYRRDARLGCGARHLVYRLRCRDNVKGYVNRDMADPGAPSLCCVLNPNAWFNPERLHPKVEALIYWRDPARSGVALGAGLALLVALACCSVVSVLAYASLLVLTGTVAFRIYKNILQAVQKTSEGHPFKWLLDLDISLPADRTQQLAAAATAHINAAGHELRRLFLVEDLIDSLKFGVVLWSLTYLGAWFNGITLIILAYVALFTLPKAYEANKAQVDANLELARTKINEISAKVRAAVPLGKKESDKDK